MSGMALREEAAPLVPRNRRALVALCLILSMVATACAGGGESRIVAFGDVHGDLEASTSHAGLHAQPPNAMAETKHPTKTSAQRVWK